MLVLAIVAVPLFTNLASASLPQSWQPFLGYSWLLLLISAVPVVVQEMRRRAQEEQKFDDDDLTILVGATPPPVPHFTGRNIDTDTIHSLLGEHAQLTVQGLPGVGKTQTVAHYARKHGIGYEFVWWIRGQNIVTIGSDLDAIADAKSLPGGRSAVLEWLRNHDRWLIVFDNVTADSSVERFIPATPSGHVIIISRERLDVTTAVVEIGDWEPQEANDFLVKVLSAPLQTRQELAAKLHFAPLALAQAANYIRLAHLTIENYLELHAKRAREMFTIEARSTRENTIAASYSLAIDAADRESPGAKQLAELWSLYADGPIPRHLPSAFGHAPSHSRIGFKSRVSLSFARKLADPLAYNAWVSALTRHLILTAEGDAFRMHPLITQVVRLSLGKSRIRNLTFFAAKALTEVYFRERLWRESSATESWKVLLPHILSLGEIALTVKPPLTSWSNFEVEVAWYCWRDVSLLLTAAGHRLATQDDLAEAERLARVSLELAKRAYAPSMVFRGKGAPYSWIALANALDACANLSAAGGNFVEAEILFRAGLREIDARTGPMHRARFVVGLTAILNTKGDHAAARRLLEKEVPKLHKRIPAGTLEREKLDEILTQQ